MGIIKEHKKSSEGLIEEVDVLIEDEFIKISSQFLLNHKVIDLEGKYLLPGVVDDQVHFRSLD